MREIAKIVFDALHLKPEEVFMVEGSFKHFKISEELELQDLDKDINENNNITLQDLLNERLKIIHVRKKTLKSLTPPEYALWRKKNCNKSCESCIFANVYCRLDSLFKAQCWINHKELYSEKFLNQEIVL